MTIERHPDPPLFDRPCSDQGYEADDAWAKLPVGWSFSEVTAVATDSRDRVYVFDRGEHPVLIFEPDGTFVDSWGEGVFARPHGIFLGPDDAVYCTDDLDHTVRKFAPDGRPLLTLGTSGTPSDSGATSIDYRTIVRAAPPFHFPTNVALSPLREIYVSDEWHFLKRNPLAGNSLENDGLTRDKLGLVHDPGLDDEEAAVASAYQRPHRSPRRFAPP